MNKFKKRNVRNSLILVEKILLSRKTHVEYIEGTPLD